MKAFNQEKALVGALLGAFSVIVKTDCGTDGALHSTKREVRLRDPPPTTRNWGGRCWTRAGHRPHATTNITPAHNCANISKLAKMFCLDTITATNIASIFLKIILLEWLSIIISSYWIIFPPSINTQQAIVSYKLQYLLINWAGDKMWQFQGPGRTF